MEFSLPRWILKQGGLLLKETAGLLFPPECVCCGRGIREGSICASCSKFSPLYGPLCDRCGISLPHGMSKCGVCLSEKGAIVLKVRSTLHLNVASRILLHRIKFGRRAELIPLFREYFDLYFSSFFSPDSVLIPVPLHIGRFLHRGFNVSSILCHWLKEKTGCHVELHSLKKIRKTGPQSGLGRAQRQSNLIRSFQWCSQNSVSHSVVLVDDVYTTGATLRACAKVLKGVGVDKIYGWTLLRTPRHGI